MEDLQRECEEFESRGFVLDVKSCLENVYIHGVDEKTFSCELNEDGTYTVYVEGTLRFEGVDSKYMSFVKGVDA